MARQATHIGPILKNLSLLLISVCVSALLVEGGLRLSGFEPRSLVANRFFVEGAGTTWSQPDDELGWVNRPGVSVSIEFGAAPMTFWSQGRRATRPTDTVAVNQKPVMFVGGSNAQSYGVADHDSFPYVIGQRFPELWVENFGNGGYSTVQALLMARRAVKKFYVDSSPKLIVLTFADSHVARNVSDQSWVYSISDSQGRYVSPPHYRMNGDALVFRPFRTIGPWPLETSSALVTLLHHIWMQSVQFDSADEGVAVTRRVFSEFHDFANEIGADFLVAVLEDRTQISSKVFEGAEFPVLDCSGYEREQPEAYLLGGDGHPNAKLHSHFSGCIGAWMKTYTQDDISRMDP